MGFIKHLFIPHERNNHRAKTLHNSSLLIIVLLLLFFNVFSAFIKTNNPNILGISYSVSEEEMFVLVNKARQENNLPPLTVSEKLTQAAKEKTTDMLAKNYWSHFAPDGTSPWYFIKNTGYSYQFAGENLAKGYTDSSEVVNAWMSSPTHRENILSDKYTDIGFAIARGKLLGEDTVLIVQMLGSEEIPINVAKETTKSIQEPVTASSPDLLGSQNRLGQSVFSKPFIDILVASKGIVMTISLVLIVALLLDLIIVERKKLPRVVGHNIDHMILIILFALFMIIGRNGVIF